MKTDIAIPLASLLATSLLLLTGCATTPEHTTPFTKQEILEQPEVRGKSPAVFPNDLQAVRKAGRRALNFVGCAVTTEEPFFLAGERPSKVGVFGNNGGETVKIFLYPEGQKQTQVWVGTDTTFFGAAGQQAWDTQVLTLMGNFLSQPMLGGAR